jgi:hypothetical protein
VKWQWAILLSGCAVTTRSNDIDLSHPALVEDLATTAGAAELLALDLSRLPDLAGIDLGALPQSWASPSTAPTDASLGWNGNYATNYRVTLAADDPGAEIYYTSDGSAPSRASLHAAAPALDIAATTRLRWFAANLAGTEAPHDDQYGVDAANQSKAGFVLHDVSLDGQGPVATVSGGTTITATATFRFWYQSAGCSGGTFPCAAQLVYGVDKSDQGCLFDGGTNNFAGSATQTKSFTVNVPSASGIHDVQVAQIEDLTCSQVVNALSTRPNLVRIGVLIVN